MRQPVLISFPLQARTEADALGGQLRARNFPAVCRPEGDLYAPALILLLTPAALEDSGVFSDAFAFYSTGKPMVCVAVESVNLPSWLAAYPRLQWRNLNLDQLIQLVQAPAPEHATQPGQPRIVVSPFAPERTIPEALTALHTAAVHGHKIMLTKQQVDEISALPPTDETTYRLIRFARFSTAEYESDSRFVRLSLAVDDGDHSQRHFSPLSRPQTYHDLTEIVEKGTMGGALVVLGLPGSGKTTLLRRLEMEMAVKPLRMGGNRPNLLPLHVSLANYGRGIGAPPSPIDWLSAYWRRMCAQMPPLIDLVEQRRMLFILDGLNEMPRESDAAHARLVEAWRIFLNDYVRNMPGNRAVFACRTIDYGGMLSSADFRVPQATLQPLTPDQVREYLQRYAPDHAVRVWSTLARDPGQLSMFRIPYLLRLLVELVNALGDIPRGRAETFTAFVRELLRRELEKQTRLLTDGPLLEPAERERIRAGAWHDKVSLPERGLLLQALRNLAYNMQWNHPGESLIALEYWDAFPLTNIDRNHQENAIRAGISLTLLDLEYERFFVRFFHQLLQEYFAARVIATTPKPDLARVEWQAERISPSLEETLAQLPADAPLPPPPATGWEVTMVMAAAITQDPESFIRELLPHNLPLAAYCAAAPDVRAGDQLKSDLRTALIARIGDPTADLRARIAAGLALGDLGDPRFVRTRGADGDYLAPPMATIPGGDYPIGSTAAPNEQPIHPVTLPAFQIGVFPVTNAEYALFVAAGGYTDSRWWPTEAAQQWRMGTLDVEPDKAEWRQRRAKRQAELASGEMDRQYAEGEINRSQYESRKRLATLSDEDFEAELASWYPAGVKTTPYHWEDQRYNNPQQPVVGVTWFEAVAYCLWLSFQSGKVYRLPTEVEREAATRGFEGRVYAYGDAFDSAKANTYETRIHRTAPVGIFPQGNTPEGVADLSGNIWEWTSSLERPYPYVATDGREDPTDWQSYRVVRGGSWYHLGAFARGAYRALYKPYHMNDNVGFRVVSAL